MEKLIGSLLLVLIINTFPVTCEDHMYNVDIDVYPDRYEVEEGTPLKICCNVTGNKPVLGTMNIQLRRPPKGKKILYYACLNSTETRLEILECNTNNITGVVKVRLKNIKWSDRGIYGCAAPGQRTLHTFPLKVLAPPSFCKCESFSEGDFQSTDLSERRGRIECKTGCTSYKPKDATFETSLQKIPFENDVERTECHDDEKGKQNFTFVYGGNKFKEIAGKHYITFRIGACEYKSEDRIIFSIDRSVSPFVIFFVVFFVIYFLIPWAIIILFYATHRRNIYRKFIKRKIKSFTIQFMPWRLVYKLIKWKMERFSFEEKILKNYITDDYQRVFITNELTECVSTYDRIQVTFKDITSSRASPAVRDEDNEGTRFLDDKSELGLGNFQEIYELFPNKINYISMESTLHISLFGKWMANKWFEAENGQVNAENKVASGDYKTRILRWMRKRGNNPLCLIYVNYNRLKYDSSKSLYDVINDRFNLDYKNPNEEVQEFMRRYSEGSLLIIIANLSGSLGQIHTVSELFDEKQTPLPNARIIAIKEESVDHSIWNHVIEEVWHKLELLKYKKKQEQDWIPFRIGHQSTEPTELTRSKKAEIDNIQGDTRGIVVISNKVHILKRHRHSKTCLITITFEEAESHLNVKTTRCMIDNKIYGIHQLSNGRFVTVMNDTLVTFEPAGNEDLFSLSERGKEYKIKADGKRIELRDITVQNDDIYVVDMNNNCCYKIELKNDEAKIVLTIGKGKLGDPSGIAINSNGSIIVSETNWIKIFDPNEDKVLHQIEIRGMYPNDLSCNSKGSILVHMRGGHEFQLLESEMTKRYVFKENAVFEDACFTDDDRIIFLKKIVGGTHFLNLTT